MLVEEKYLRTGETYNILHILIASMCLLLQYLLYTLDDDLASF